jgi:hypothetical protein
MQSILSSVVVALLLFIYDVSLLASLLQIFARTLSTSVITFIAPGTKLNHEKHTLYLLCGGEIQHSTPPDLDEKDDFQ